MRANFSKQFDICIQKGAGISDTAYNIVNKCIKQESAQNKLFCAARDSESKNVFVFVLLSSRLFSSLFLIQIAPSLTFFFC